MLHFCPHCFNLLLLENTDRLRFVCQTCPFTRIVSEPITVSVTLEKKQVDDVLGGPEQWKNADKMSCTPCTKCGNAEAYFMQLQIRSADEPSTTFLRCTSCANRWSEN